MADDEKTKAEKLAAAKKRVEAMKKKKNKKAGSSKTKEEAEPAAAAEAEAEAAPAEEKLEEKPEVKADEAVEEKNEEAVEDTKPDTEEPSTEDRPASPSQAQPSLAQQSKLRSASFRKGSISTGVTGPLSPGPFSPDGESATDIYRKHVTRIEELEKENKRLAKDATESEKRWKKAEEDLADLREEDGDASAKPPASDEQVDKLKSEIAALERQNSQLQQQVSRGTARHGSSPSSTTGSPPAVAELEARLIDKSATIETMELEISKLRAQLERSTSDREQIPALEERVARSEKAAGFAQGEFADFRRNLDPHRPKRPSGEGSEGTSPETKLRPLGTNLARHSRGPQAQKKAEEQTRGRRHSPRPRKRPEKEASSPRPRSRPSTQGPTLRAASRRGRGGLETRRRRARDKRPTPGEEGPRARERESRPARGLWQDKRRQLSGGQDVASPGGGFQDVDLGGASPLAGRKHGQHGGGGLGDFFQSGINALTGHGGDEDGFLEDDDMDFDEDAFRQAQADDAKARLERIKDIKRGLKNWEGWRLDLVEIRRGGEEGHGEVFEV
ncbi:conserved hypothetical protein [Verticillium alfalfae VaMs.102]|uniref:M protein repeat protein n=1 Tax=Verticillium alfalfae (strain VaMs.102 / ATCC MYA-4576 / FGSC 10136) TaxID=526221 RepID=C9S6P1_VERA1|nr:conserved hypothetical protein [Verticillium alfalfae VaMs.102]EEY14532.1 conserved hypothetical protein [Verticillium alfalfae VaMs.102]